MQTYCVTKVNKIMQWKKCWSRKVKGRWVGDLEVKWMSVNDMSFVADLHCRSESAKNAWARSFVVFWSRMLRASKSDRCCTWWLMAPHGVSMATNRSAVWVGSMRVVSVAQVGVFWRHVRLSDRCSGANVDHWGMYCRWWECVWMIV